MNPGSEKCTSENSVFNKPVVGLNDNLDFLGKQLHIQTEFIELPAARISTQVFCRGRVLLSKKTECPPGVRESHDFQKLQQIMNAQHHQVIQEITDKQARVLASQ
ncbi:MAG: hypothetical protein JXA73_27025 [Acidobacteria bacterium]|nr:hypothetical protein [Acidobacteriota bacterium]